MLHNLKGKFVRPNTEVVKSELHQVPLQRPVCRIYGYSMGPFNKPATYEIQLEQMANFPRRPQVGFESIFISIDKLPHRGNNTAAMFAIKFIQVCYCIIGCVVFSSSWSLLETTRLECESRSTWDDSVRNSTRIRKILTETHLKFVYRLLSVCSANTITWFWYLVYCWNFLLGVRESLELVNLHSFIQTLNRNLIPN